ncbi:hypothetical protein [Vibrio parahaemolyticus]|uniref:hypothetical protein n=1 Tax=Vibrio parahaemolyticus TaxID=670 RepID=UPI00226A1C79|nr:hypothetical protein [Vibrio parahaemolyticus]MCX8796115.1 hypothetical protein [Vibrio parahaemolyticus]
MFELFKTFVLVIIPSLMFSLTLQEYFQSQFERQLFVDRKPLYRLVLAFAVSFPMNLALIINAYSPAHYSYLESAFLFVLSVTATTAIIIRSYNNIEYFGTYCVHYSKKKSCKTATVHFTPSVNAKLARKGFSKHSEFKKLYHDILFDSLDKIDSDTSIITIKSPMLRASSHSKIAKAFKDDPRVLKVEREGKKNLIIDIYYFLFLSFILRAHVKLRDVYTINIVLCHNNMSAVKSHSV